MIKDICEKIGFQDEATEELSAALAKILSCEKCADLLKKAQDTMYLSDESFNPVLEELTAACGLHRYTVNMVFWLYSAIPLRYIYKQRGLPEEIYLDSMKDLTYKLKECRDVYGICGTFVDWFKLFYLCKRFALGRLEYERQPFALDAYRDILKKGDTVINIHIPSSGKLMPNDVIASLKKAYEFFSDEVREDGTLVFHCHSWMLHTPMADSAYRDGSNMKAFYDIFDIVEVTDSDSYPNFWRVYNMPYTEGAFDKAPTDTSFRRDLLTYLKNGGKMGSGRGIILFDGEKIIK